MVSIEREVQLECRFCGQTTLHRVIEQAGRQTLVWCRQCSRPRTVEAGEIVAEMPQD